MIEFSAADSAVFCGFFHGLLAVKALRLIPSHMFGRCEIRKNGDFFRAQLFLALSGYDQNIFAANFRATGLLRVALQKIGKIAALHFFMPLCELTHQTEFSLPAEHFGEFR